MTTTELNKDGNPKGGRPTTLPLRVEGKWVYCRLGNGLMKYPAEIDAYGEKMAELIKTINTGFDKNYTTMLTASQDAELSRFIRNHCQVLA